MPDFGGFYRTPVVVCSALSTTVILPASRSMCFQRKAITASAPVAGVFTVSYGLTPTITSSVGGSSPTDTLTVGSASGGSDAANLTALNNVLSELL